MSDEQREPSPYRTVMDPHANIAEALKFADRQAGQPYVWPSEPATGFLGEFEAHMRAERERLAALTAEQYQAEMAERRSEVAARTAQVHADHSAAVVAATSPLARSILQLHRPNEDGNYCEGCDFGPYGDADDYPCRTVDLILASMGGGS